MRLQLSENIRRMRKERGLTQVALQMNTGIEQSLLSKYENNNRVPPIETLVVLADYFNVSVDYLIYRSDDPESGKKTN